MILSHEHDVQTSCGQTNFGPRASSAWTASSRETGRVARILAQEIANPASAQDCGVFFDSSELI
jgi:hypothetical protein